MLITVSLVSPQTVQVNLPFPSLPQVAASTTSSSPHAWAGSIVAYPNSASHNAQAYFPTPATVHVASFNVLINSSTWLVPSAAVVFSCLVAPQTLQV